MDDSCAVCRWCTCSLKYMDKKSNVFEHNSVIVKLINRCFGVEVKRMSSVPEKICEDCIEQIRHINTLRETIYEAEKRWEEISKSLTINAEKPNVKSEESLEALSEAMDPERDEIFLEESEQDCFEDQIPSPEPETQQTNYIEVEEQIEGFIAFSKSDIIGMATDDIVEEDFYSSIIEEGPTDDETDFKSFHSVDENFSPKRPFEKTLGSKKITCSVCGFLATKKYMETHMKRHNIVRVKCDLCDKELKPDNLNLHKYRMHAEKKPPEKTICDICGKICKDNIALGSHRHDQHLRKNKQCPICKKIVRRLDKHIQTAHKNKPEPCPKCGKIYKSLFIKLHLKRCGMEPTLPCDVCGKMYFSTSDLKDHRNKHFGITVPCLFCSYDGPDRRTRNNHMRAKHPEEYEAHKAAQAEKKILTLED